jgi:hypothetical protein
LLPEVGAAIAAYLQDGRPVGPCRHVFLRNEAPRVALGADAIGLIVRRALNRAGLPTSAREPPAATQLGDADDPSWRVDDGDR